MTTALTIFAAWFTGCLALSLFACAGYLWHLDHEDDTPGIFIAIGALSTWGFMAVLGLTS